MSAAVNIGTREVFNEDLVQGESGVLICRWSDLLEGDRSNSPISQDTSGESYASFLPPPPDFAAHSPLGSGEWFVPWNSRWSVPRP
jgi:hypothetical protein